MPARVVGDPAAERRPERRRDDDAEQEDRLHHALLAPRKDLAQRGLRRREQRRAAGALHEPPEHELRRGCVDSAAQHRRDDEDDDREREVALAAEHLGEERRHRQDDDVGEDVGGADPGDFLARGAEVAGHLRQRDVDDGGVEHLHDRGRDQAEQDEPARARDGLVEARPAARAASAAAAALIGGTPSPSPTCRAAARRRRSAPRSSTIFTGTRCTTLTKLPLALSGGSRLNVAPVAAGDAVHVAGVRRGRRTRPPTTDARCPARRSRELRLLEVGDDPHVVERRHRHQRLAGLHDLADFDGCAG